MTVNILGTDYAVIKKQYDADPYFKEQSVDGYCDGLMKEIVCCDMATYPSWEKEPKDRVTVAEKQTLRHEIVHAFFNESGLEESTFRVDGAWAKNEEMVDWIALQGPKIYEAWRAAGAL